MTGRVVSAQSCRSGSLPSWLCHNWLSSGRRTYEVLAGLPEEARDASWHRMTKLSKVVFSRTFGEDRMAEHAHLS